MRKNKKYLEEQIKDFEAKIKNLNEIKYDYQAKLDEVKNEYNILFVKTYKFKVTYLDWDGKEVKHYKNNQTVEAKDEEDAFKKTFHPEWGPEETVEYAYVTKENGPKKYFTIQIGVDYDFGEIYVDKITYKEYKRKLKEHFERIERIHKAEEERWQKKLEEAIK